VAVHLFAAFHDRTIGQRGTLPPMILWSLQI